MLFEKYRIVLTRGQRYKAQIRKWLFLYKDIDANSGIIAYLDYSRTKEVIELHKKATELNKTDKVVKL